MPRRPRILLAGLLLRSVQRGHNREACFFGEDDYLTYRHWLGEALKESGYALHAYVLTEQPCVLAADSTAAPKNVPRLIISLGRR
jgi:putative transposase